MKEVIVDTSALVEFFVSAERHHLAARHYFLENSKTHWIILNTVFDETVTWVRAKISIKASIEISHILRTEHRYVMLSDVDDAATWEAFCRYNDKFWSYTDCSILVMAQRLAVLEVFSFDVHIRQVAGLGIISVP